MSDREIAYEVEQDGKPIAGAYPHPRMIGMWLAVVPPQGWRDSGMRKFKTRRGAVRFVDARLAAQDPRA